jgi:hypothetical protein
MKRRLVIIKKKLLWNRRLLKITEDEIVKANNDSLISSKFVLVNEIVYGRIKRFWGFN